MDPVDQASVDTAAALNGGREAMASALAAKLNLPEATVTSCAEEDDAQPAQQASSTAHAVTVAQPAQQAPMGMN